MPVPPKSVELNEPARKEGHSELRQYLISASNELFLFEMVSARVGRPIPAALDRAHRAIRAELKRLSEE